MSLSIHEFSHGYAAYKLGDPTAKERGRLTLNPLRHLDIRGLLMMVARRRKLLDYAKRTNPDLYKDLLVRLSLRH